MDTEQVQPETQTETEEENLLETISETVENDQTTEDEGDAPQEVYFDIDGEETSLTDIKAWKSGHMMQSDYTKKAQEAAELRRTAEAKTTQAQEAIDALNAMEEDLLGMFSEDSIDMEELRQTDTAEYLRLKEQKEDRQRKLVEMREKRVEMQNALVADEQEKLFALRGWDKDPELKQADSDLLTKMVKDRGVNLKAFGAITDHTIVSLLVDAAKYHDLQQRKPSVTKLVKGKAKETSASNQSQTKAKSMADVFYGSN